ncbi:MAG TPA: ABC transporter substrate-binding protein [Naasia sp.]|jgi:ABC-type nitrate/sulfonate/bicarbonate transport system substrate-binding protein
MHKRSTPALAAFAVVAFALAGCATASSPEAAPSSAPAASGAPSDDACPMPESMATATVATNPGAQDLVIKHVKEGGFDTKYNLDLQVQEFQNPPATAQAIVQKAVNLGFGGLTTMVQARDTGADVIFVGALSTPGNGMFVKEDSPYQSIGDLKGKKVGSFTALNGAITSIMQAYAQESEDFNLLEDTDGEVVVAPDAALIGLLDQGQLEAVILGVDATAVQQFEGTYRQIVDLRTDFPDTFDFQALYLGPVTTEEYAEAHCGEVRAYASAIRDAVLDIQENEEIWETYVEAIGQPQDAAETFQELYSESWVTEWSEEEVDGMKQLVTTLTPYLDPAFPKEVDPALFSLDYPVFEE